MRLSFVQAPRHFSQLGTVHEPTREAGGAIMNNDVKVLRRELAQEVQLREAALSRLMEAVSLETNARVAKGAELRRELHAMVKEYADQIQPMEKFERSLTPDVSQPDNHALKEISKLWHVLNVHTHAINVDVEGKLCASRSAAHFPQIPWTPALSPPQICMKGPAISYSPPRPTRSYSPPRMETLPLMISSGASSPPMIVAHPPRVVRAPSPVEAITRPVSTSPRLLMRACSSAPQADVEPPSVNVITTKTILPATVQSVVADVDSEDVAPVITATCGSAHYVLGPE